MAADAAQGDAAWAALGLSPDDVRTYRSVVEATAATAPDLGDTTSLGVVRVRRSLRRLVEAKLVDVEGRMYRARRPQTAMARSIDDRRAALDTLTTVVDSIDRLWTAGSAFAQQDELFEVVRGAVDIRHRLRELVAATRSQLSVIDTPPYVSSPDPVLHDEEAAARARGVVIRNIVHVSALDDPAHVRDIQRSLREGQTLRLSPRLRTKLIIFDDAHAAVPVAMTPAASQPHVAIVSLPEIVDALRGYFDLLFDDAHELDAARGRAGAPSPDDEFVQLLSMGMTDVAIARTLDISERSVRRRIAALQDEYGARGRFQLGRAMERAAGARGGEPSS